MTRSTTTPRLPVGVRTDLPVLVAVLACWLALPLFWAHVLTGLAMAGLIAHHLRTRRGKVRRLFGAGRVRQPVLRRAAYWTFLALTAAMVASGLLRWAGVPPEYALHSWASYFLLSAVALHVLLVRRRLWTRLRTRRRHPAPPPPSP